MVEALAGQNCRIVLTEKHRHLSEHERRFNLPVYREANVLMLNEPAGHRDIIIQHRHGAIHRIDNFHRCYDALHYVILRPFGSNGWLLSMKIDLYITARQY